MKYWHNFKYKLTSFREKWRGWLAWQFLLQIDVTREHTPNLKWFLCRYLQIAARFFKPRLHARWWSSPATSGAFSATNHYGRVRPYEEPHPPSLCKLSRIGLGQYDTESTASAGCALVWCFYFLRVAAPSSASGLLQGEASGALKIKSDEPHSSSHMY
jgi:hypothetical protein